MQSSPLSSRSERLQLSNCREVLTGRGKEGGTEEGNSFFQFVITSGVWPRPQVALALTATSKVKIELLRSC